MLISQTRVFLRVLEYYQGILFLTTNRNGKMDEAFQSRVHISLYYPTLFEKSAIDSFRENIALIKKGKVNPIRIKEHEIKSFAKDHHNYSEPRTRWNSRQIRNAFHIEIVLAENEAVEKSEKSNKKGDKKVVAVREPLSVDYVISGAGNPTSGGFFPIYKASQFLSTALRSSQAIITFYYPK